MSDIDGIDIDNLPTLDDREYPSDKRFEFVVFTGCRLAAAMNTQIEWRKDEERLLKMLIKFIVQALKFYKHWWKN